MSHERRQTTLNEQTHQLLQGPLKHIRMAALAAALVPLASVAATPAAAQSSQCASGGICGFVWSDTNNNGVQDLDELGIGGAVVSLDSTWYVTQTDASGFYYFSVGAGSYTMAVQIPNGTQPSPADVGDDSLDSDGTTDGMGNSTTLITLTEYADPNTDFGFFVPAFVRPGTGTPGYWKDHPEAWPAGISVGGLDYTSEVAISWLERVGKDRTITMFSSLVSAKLNVGIGTDASCVASTIADADSWMATYAPAGVGSGVHASSFAWKVGEPLHRLMDNYNNGMLCAPHRD